MTLPLVEKSPSQPTPDPLNLSLLPETTKNEREKGSQKKQSGAEQKELKTMFKEQTFSSWKEN